MKSVKKINNYDVLVNKHYKLELNQIPNINELTSFKTVYSDEVMYLENCVYQMFMKLKKEALINGYQVDTDSTFRTYQEQVDTMNEFIKLIGEEKARVRVAEPLSSEHHLGLAIDLIFVRNGKIIEGDAIKDDDPDYIWILKNLSDYGFIIRYPKDTIEITGTIYEPWHIRYVGIELAKYLEQNKLLLEEYWIEKNKLKRK